MEDSDDSPAVSRRTLLRASAVAIGTSTIATGQASASQRGAIEGAFDRQCPEATLQPSMGHCRGASFEGCADDHPATIELQAAVRKTLEEHFPDAGALAEAGFKPYFDALDDGDDDGWSHWLNPTYIGDDAVLDPHRPESVLVDNDSWRSIGVMFIATRSGKAVEPPAVSEAGDEGFDGPVEDATDTIDLTDDGPGHEQHDGEHDHAEGHGEHERGKHHDGEHEHSEGHDGDERTSDDHRDDEEHGHEHRPDGGEDRCSPWHYHAGLPGRFAWWYYQQVYERSFADGDVGVPCRTPCMMHVWTVDHPEGVYAHGAPPAEYRDYPPAEDPVLETDAEPGEDTLSWETLPEDVAPERRPEERSWFGPF